VGLPVSERDIAAAAQRIAPYVRTTPVLTTVVGDRPVTFKLEHLQLTGSFKVRGALNAMLRRPDRGRPVVTASGGNHGLGVATAASLLKVPATVYVPETVPAAKARRIEAAGGIVVRRGSRYADAMIAAQAHAEATGAHYLPAYDDVDVVAGQGTVGREIAGQAPDCDAIVVAVGGGGLIAGLRAALPDHDIVGVEPPGCACLHAAVAAGEPVDVELDSVTASALGATRLGGVPWEVLRCHPTVAGLELVRPGLELVRPGLEPMRPGLEPMRPGLEPMRPGLEPVRPGLEPVRPGLEPMRPGLEPVRPGLEPVRLEVMAAAERLALTRGWPVHLAMVDDSAILAARDRLWDEFRLAVEPAAAAPFAALLAGLVPGDHPCLVLCGANTDWQPCG
jgi:threonine dehydratase